MSRVAIIGAGMAGLACARRLAEAGHQPILFDKGRGIGGRMATRRAGALRFDHGAQYVTAKQAGFAAVLSDLAKAGAAAKWDDGAARTHFVGTPGMSSIPKALGAGLDIRQGQRVTSIMRDNGGWSIHTEGEVHRSGHVVITVPAPQVAELIGAEHPLVQQITDVRMAPCLTLMAAIDAPAPFISQRDDYGPFASIIQDSSKPGRPESTATAWVAQASLEFTRAHLEEGTPQLAERMLPLLCERLGVSQDRVQHAAAHRWLYARVTTPLGQPFARGEGGTLYLGGDWCLGARVEAAWTSGTAIAEDLVERLG
ncbi:MAG: FAD-dependent oxidoreductase [Roseovarius sp.]